METRYAPRGQKKGKKNGFWTFIIVVAILGLSGKYIYDNYIPSFEQATPQYKYEHPIVTNGTVSDYEAVIENEQIKLPLPLLQDWLGEDNPIHYEEDSGTLIFTTSDHVLKLKTDSLTGKLNQKPYELRIVAEKVDGTIYIPLAPLEELYGLQANRAQGSGIVTLYHEGQVIQQLQAESGKGTAVRTTPSIKSPFLFKVKSEEKLQLWGEEKDWYLVQLEDGHLGYIKKKDAKLTTKEQIPPLEKAEPFVAWKLDGKKINMTWEAVYQRPINPDNIGEMQGLNVVSPTWFELVDGKGAIKGKADNNYIKWAHDRGYQVWALFNNSFDPEMTTEALSTAESRFYMIQQLLAFAEIYKLQGINIDFENVHTKDKENFVQFIRELTPLLHEQGLVVSVDVTPKSNSEMWSLFLDRPALAKSVDFMMVMAYDEHWAASPKSGSVASLPWTEQSIKRIIEDDGVPPEKLVLSMPLYTRVWTEEKQEDGKVKVSSKAYGMDKIKSIIEEKKLTPVLDEQAGQHYVEYTEEGSLKRIWIEDDLSIAARIELVKKHRLAGVATWQRGFQTSSIWKTIDEHLQK